MVVIVYAHDGSSIYGANIYDLLFLRHLSRNNSVHFLTFNQKRVFVPKKVVVSKLREPLATSLDNRVWAEGLRMYLFCLLRALLFRLQLRRLKPDVVFGCMATKYGFYAALSGFKPFILIIWGSDILISPKRFFFFRFMVKYSLKKAEAVILDSSVQKKAAMQLGCKPSKILKFPWFDLESLRVMTSKQETREKLGWRDNPIIICTRSHEPIYGVEYLIEAIPRILSEVPESRFLIIGKGQLTQSLQRRVRELGVDNYVKFVGSVPREEVISYLNTSDVNVSMSMSDGTSASLLEGMALGVPAVATAIPGNKEWIKDGFNGFLIPIKDSQRLAETIVALLKNKALRQKLGEKAVETVKRKVDWSRTSQVITELVSRLIQYQT